MNRACASRRKFRPCTSRIALAALVSLGLCANGAAQAQQALQGAVAKPGQPGAPAKERPRDALPKSAQQSLRLNPPLPPPRPPELSAPARPAPGEPERTGTTAPWAIPAPSAAPSAAPAPLLAPSPAPAPLQIPPPAPPTPLAQPQERAALRACAEAWGRMQASGEAGGILWRDFSAACLARGAHVGGDVGGDVGANVGAEPRAQAPLRDLR